MMVEMYRQGDVLLKKIKKIPKQVTITKSNIILRGEATGHAHQLVNGFIYTAIEEMYIEANKGAKIVHEEHNSVELEPGVYEVIRQREYEPEAEKRRRWVSD